MVSKVYRFSPNSKIERNLDSGSASSSTEKTVEVLPKVVQELMGEIKEMKEESATALPRKVAAKSVTRM